MKSINILTPGFNQEVSVEELYNRVRNAMFELDYYRYEQTTLITLTRQMEVDQ